MLKVTTDSGRHLNHTQIRTLSACRMTLLDSCSVRHFGSSQIFFLFRPTCPACSTAMTAPANFASIVAEYQLMEMTELDPDYERLYRALQDHLSILPEAVGPGNILQGNQVCNQFVNHSGCRGRAPASAHQCAFLHPEFVDARWMPRDNICYRHLRQQARHPLDIPKAYQVSLRTKRLPCVCTI